MPGDRESCKQGRARIPPPPTPPPLLPLRYCNAEETRSSICSPGSPDLRFTPASAKILPLPGRADGGPLFLSLPGLRGRPAGSLRSPPPPADQPYG